MNSDIRYLQLLEDDLRDAAERERMSTDTAAAPPGIASHPRRHPRRGWNWGGVAAAIVGLLVVAGGIGFLAQPHGSRPAAAFPNGANEPGSAPAQRAKAAPGVAPVHRSAGAFGGSDPFSDPNSLGGSGTGVKDASIAGAPTDLSKIERDGQIGILIPDKTFSQHVAGVTSIAVSNGGMVLSSSTQNEKTGTFTLRIPAKRFENAMLRLRAMGAGTGAQILYQNSTGQDVTAQFVDLKARLAIVRGTKARLVSLQSKATTTSEILALGNQIDQVQLQIEQLQGQINYIDNQVAESTIKVELRERDVPINETTNNSVEQPSLGSAWSRSLQGFLRVLGAVIVGLGYLIPIALIAVGAWFVVMLVRRRRRATSSAP